MLAVAVVFTHRKQCGVVGVVFSRNCSVRNKEREEEIENRKETIEIGVMGTKAMVWKNGAISYLTPLVSSLQESVWLHPELVRMGELQLTKTLWERFYCR